MFGRFGGELFSSSFAISISHVTKDGRLEFTTGLYISVAHLLKLAIAVTVVGVCVVLPALLNIYLNKSTVISFLRTFFEVRSFCRKINQI